MGGALYHAFGYQAVFASAYVIIALDILFRILMIERPPEHHQLVGERSAIVHEQGKSNAGELYGTFRSPLDAELSGDHEEQRNVSGSDDLLLSSESGDEFDSTSMASKSQSDSIDELGSSSVLPLLSSPRMLTALLGSLVLSFEITLLETDLPLYIKRVFGLNTRDIGLIVLCSVFPYVFGPPIGVMSERWGYRLIITTGYALLAPFWILLRLVNHPGAEQVALLCVLIFAKCVALNLVLGPAFSEAKASVDEQHEQQPGKLGGKKAYGMAYALMNMAYALGSFLGPVLGSVVIEWVGWANMTMMMGIMFACCVVPSILFVGGKHERRSAIAEETEV